MPPAARANDPVVGIDLHIELVPSPGGPVPTPTPSPFSGTITSGTEASVTIDGQPAAVVGSAATNNPAHQFVAGPYQVPPLNRGTVAAGSATVLIGGKPAARVGDLVTTCTDLPWPSQPRIVSGSPTVMIA
ncbi:MAG: PAAR domain-containing protein [Kineosporiaceae bacterium]